MKNKKNNSEANDNEIISHYDVNRENNNENSFEDYMSAVARGLKQFAHDVIVEPIDLMTDAQVIAASLSSAQMQETQYCFNPEACAFRHLSVLAANNPDVVVHAKERMQDRFDGLKNMGEIVMDASVIMHHEKTQWLMPQDPFYTVAQKRMDARFNNVAHIIKQSSGPELIESLTPLAATFITPWLGYKALEMHARHKTIGLWTKPPLFHNRHPEAFGPPDVPIKRLTANEIQSSWGNQHYIWALEPNGKMHYGQRGSTMWPHCHSDLVFGRPVIATGEVEFWNGTLVEGFPNNKTGHYFASGPKSEKAAIFAFQRDGFPVSYIESYIYHEPKIEFKDSFAGSILEINRNPVWGRKQFEHLENVVEKIRLENPSITQARLLYKLRMEFGESNIVGKSNILNPIVKKVIENKNGVLAGFSFPVSVSAKMSYGETKEKVRNMKQTSGDNDKLNQQRFENALNESPVEKEDIDDIKLKLSKMGIEVTGKLEKIVKTSDTVREQVNTIADYVIQKQNEDVALQNEHERVTSLKSASACAGFIGKLGQFTKCKELCQLSTVVQAGIQIKNAKHLLDVANKAKKVDKLFALANCADIASAVLSVIIFPRFHGHQTFKFRLPIPTHLVPCSQ